MQAIATHPVKCGDHLWHADTCRWTRIKPIYDEDTGMTAADRDAIREFVAQYGGYKSHLLAKIFHALREWFRLSEWYEIWAVSYLRVAYIDSLWASYMRRELEQRQRELKRLDWQIKITKDRLDNKPMPKNHITDEMIARARAYPVHDILSEFGVPPLGGRYPCPYHDGVDPNMSVKHNRVNCFKCGKKDDAIGLYQELAKVSFPAAVRTLCGGA